VAPHLTVDGQLDARGFVRYFETALRSTATTLILPVAPTRSTEELRSPFPPHQISSANTYVLKEPQAATVLRMLRAAVRGEAD
jgi:hypothetical protein